MVDTAPSANSPRENSDGGSLGSRTLYDRVGGDRFFTDLVNAFYEGVSTDLVLGPLYPEYPDFSGANLRLRDFLIQYWGGPASYSERRGHPRLRMRHFPYHIGVAERDRWLALMTEAVELTINNYDCDTTVALELTNYFRQGADHLRNDE